MFTIKVQECYQVKKDQFRFKRAKGERYSSRLRFYIELKKISRYTIHHKSVSMKKIMVDQIPDFTVGRASVLEKENYVFVDVSKLIMSTQSFITRGPLVTIVLC